MRRRESTHLVNNNSQSYFCIRSKVNIKRVFEMFHVSASVSVCGGGGPATLQGAAVFLVGWRAVTNPGQLLIGRQPVLRHRLTSSANTQGLQRVRQS